MSNKTQNSQLLTIAKEILQERHDIEEITLGSGDAAKYSSLNLFGNLTKFAPRIERAIDKKYGKGSVDPWSVNYIRDRNDADDIFNNVVDSDILKDMLTYSVDMQGSYYLLVIKHGGRNKHFLIDISQPLAKLVIGRIDTEPSTGAYSMKTLFGIDSQVVHWSNVASEYKGQGFGAFLYDKLLYLYGTLESDTILYQGSYAMWTKHLPKVSKFFGATIGSRWSGGTQSGANNIVIPITADEANDKKFVSNSLGSFVAFEASVPTEVKKIAAFTKGLSLRNQQYAVIHIDTNIDKTTGYGGFREPADDTGSTWLQQQQSAYVPFTDIVQNGYSYADLCDLISDAHGVRHVGGDRRIDSNKTKKMIILFKNATALVQPKGDIGDGEIDYALL